MPNTVWRAIDSWTNLDRGFIVSGPESPNDLIAFIDPTVIGWPADARRIAKRIADDPSLLDDWDRIWEGEPGGEAPDWAVIDLRAFCEITSREPMPGFVYSLTVLPIHPAPGTPQAWPRGMVGGRRNQLCPYCPVRFPEMHQDLRRKLKRGPFEDVRAPAGPSVPAGDSL